MKSALKEVLEVLKPLYKPFIRALGSFVEAIFKIDISAFIPVGMNLVEIKYFINFIKYLGGILMIIILIVSSFLYFKIVSINHEVVQDSIYIIMLIVITLTSFITKYFVFDCNPFLPDSIETARDNYGKKDENDYSCLKGFFNFAQLAKVMIFSRGFRKLWSKNQKKDPDEQINDMDKNDQKSLFKSKYNAFKELVAYTVIRALLRMFIILELFDIAITFAFTLEIQVDKFSIVYITLFSSAHVFLFIRSKKGRSAVAEYLRRSIVIYRKYTRINRRRYC